MRVVVGHAHCIAAAAVRGGGFAASLTSDQPEDSTLLCNK